MRLLSAAPTDWVQQTTKPGYLLTAFSEDHTYYVWASTVGHGNDAGLILSPTDLRSLPTGQVWAAPKPYADPRAMTIKDFHRHATASC